MSFVSPAVRMQVKFAVAVALVALAVAAGGSLGSYFANRTAINKVSEARLESCKLALSSNSVLRKIILVARAAASSPPGFSEQEKQSLAFYDQILTFLPDGSTCE